MFAETVNKDFSFFSQGQIVTEAAILFALTKFEAKLSETNLLFRSRSLYPDGLERARVQIDSFERLLDRIRIDFNEGRYLKQIREDEGFDFEYVEKVISIKN